MIKIFVSDHLISKKKMHERNLDFALQNTISNFNIALEGEDFDKQKLKNEV